MTEDTNTTNDVTKEDFEQGLRAGAFRALARRGFPGKLEMAEDGMPANLELMDALIRFQTDPRLAKEYLAFRDSLESGDSQAIEKARNAYAEAVVALYSPEPRWLRENRRQYIQDLRDRRASREARE